jgi:hypothetical protein
MTHADFDDRGAPVMAFEEPDERTVRGRHFKAIAERAARSARAALLLAVRPPPAAAPEADRAEIGPAVAEFWAQEARWSRATLPLAPAANEPWEP